LLALKNALLTKLSRYKRPYPYTLTEFQANDYTALIVNDPTLLSIGGNTQGPGRFVGLDIGNLRGGVINGRNLLQGDNFACFCQPGIPQRIEWTKADATTGYRLLLINLENKLPGAVGAGLISSGGTLGGVIDTIFGKLIKGPGGVASCPTFTGEDMHGFTQFCSVRSQLGGIL
jgi:hypothetical protein